MHRLGNGLDLDFACRFGLVNDAFADGLELRWQGNIFHVADDGGAFSAGIGDARGDAGVGAHGAPCGACHRLVVHRRQLFTARAGQRVAVGGQLVATAQQGFHVHHFARQRAEGARNFDFARGGGLVHHLLFDHRELRRDCDFFGAGGGLQHTLGDRLVLSRHFHQAHDVVAGTAKGGRVNCRLVHALGVGASSHGGAVGRRGGHFLGLRQVGAALFPLGGSLGNDDFFRRVFIHRRHHFQAFAGGHGFDLFFHRFVAGGHHFQLFAGGGAFHTHGDGFQRHFHGGLAHRGWAHFDFFGHRLVGGRNDFDALAGRADNHRLGFHLVAGGHHLKALGSRLDFNLFGRRLVGGGHDVQALGGWLDLDLFGHGLEACSDRLGAH